MSDGYRMACALVLLALIGCGVKVEPSSYKLLCDGGLGWATRMESNTPIRNYRGRWFAGDDPYRTDAIYRQNQGEACRIVRDVQVVERS